MSCLCGCLTCPSVLLVYAPSSELVLKTEKQLSPGDWKHISLVHIRSMMIRCNV